jgi:hypothetical protein
MNLNKDKFYMKVVEEKKIYYNFVVYDLLI